MQNFKKNSEGVSWEQLFTGLSRILNNFDLFIGGLAHKQIIWGIDCLKTEKNINFYDWFWFLKIRTFCRAFADLKQFWLFSVNEKLHYLSETNAMKNTCFKTFILIIVSLTPLPSSFEFSKIQILVQTYYSLRYSNQMNFGLWWSEKMYFKNPYIDIEVLYLVSRNAMFLTAPYWTNGKMRKSKFLH